MVKADDLVLIGKITKLHGIDGEVVCHFTDDVFDRGDSAFLFLELDGLPVPFEWEEYRFKGAEDALFKFVEAPDEASARHLVGAKVYYPKEFIPELDESEGLPSYRALIGFQVKDAEGHSLGVVNAVDDSSANILLTVVDAEDRVLLLPYHDDFLLHFDLRERILQLRLPEGLLDLNV